MKDVWQAVPGTRFFSRNGEGLYERLTDQLFLRPRSPVRVLRKEQGLGREDVARRIPVGARHACEATRCDGEQRSQKDGRSSHPWWRASVM